MSKEDILPFINGVFNTDLGSECPYTDERRDEDEQQELTLFAVESINFPTNAFILNLKKIFL